MKFIEKQIKMLEIFVKASANKKRIKILLLINEQPNLNIEEISDSVKIHYQTGASHIQRLERAGLLIKSYKGFEVEHKITKRGKKFLDFFQRILDK